MVSSIIIDQGQGSTSSHLYDYEPYSFSRKRMKVTFVDPSEGQYNCDESSMELSLG